MRIAQVMAGAPTGGAEVFFERLSASLAHGDEVLAVIRRNAARAARLRAAGLDPVELRFGGVLDLRTRARLSQALRTFQPRVTVAWMGRATAATPSGPWVLVGRLGGTYDLRRFRRCDHLVANTRGLVSWITDQDWPAARVHYLPNFAPDLRGAPVPREAVGLPQGKLIVALGRLHRNKAFDVLIRAAARVTDVHLLIAGEGPERDRLAALGGEVLPGCLMLPGWRQDTAALLHTADVVVCSSRIEPLGNVVIEAWSAGCPVVAAAAAGPRELIRHDVDGLLVPVEDAEALGAAVRRVLDSPALATALVTAGRARYETEFAETPVLARWRAFLGRVEKA